MYVLIGDGYSSKITHVVNGFDRGEQTFIGYVIGNVAPPDDGVLLQNDVIEEDEPSLTYDTYELVSEVFEKEIELLARLGIIDVDDIKTTSKPAGRFDGWKPVTIRQLTLMSTDDHHKLMSYCWHEGKYRCHGIGITDLASHYMYKGTDHTYYTLSWSDENGDPKIEVPSLDTPIGNVGDGEWNYGIYQKIAPDNDKQRQKPRQ